MKRAQKGTRAQKFALIALLFLSLACNFLTGNTSEPTSTLEAGSTKQPASQTTTPQVSDTPIPSDIPSPTQIPAPDVEFQGVSFSYDSILAEHVNAERIPAFEGDEIAFWMLLPEHIQFSFIEYVDKNSFHEPKIYVYPVEEFKSINENAVFVFDELNQLLLEKPTEGLESIPFLPVWNAAQMMSTNITYFDFKNGSGVRFLTQYGQALWPINNNGVFYTYQGMTDDGEFYLAAVFPVSHPLLPDAGEEVINGDFDAFFENYESYIDVVTNLVNTQDASSFILDLNLLDALIRSIQVANP